MPPESSPASSRPPFATWIDDSNSITRQFMELGGRKDIVSLAGGLPAAEFYPVSEIAAATQRAFERWGAAVLEYGPIEGFPALRAHIAERMSRLSSRAFGPENVILTTGAMQGLDLLGKLLIEPGDVVVAQTPTYVGALDAWRPRRPKYRPLDWEGAAGNPDEALRRARFVYAVPNYSNPTGALVPTDLRQRLLEQVVAAGTWLVEDDPYLPLQFDGDAGPSILALHGAMHPEGPYRGPVIYLGTLSKSIVPGMRVGWVVADSTLVPMLALAKQSTDISGSMLTHAVALELLESGIEDRHVPMIVEKYRERRDALCESAARHLGEWFQWETPPGGMFVWMRARNAAIDTDALYQTALKEKVAFVPSSVFDPTGRDRSAMRVNFTRSSPEILEEGCRRLAAATRRYLATKR